jgi:hypothetical protein
MRQHGTMGRCKIIVRLLLYRKQTCMNIHAVAGPRLIRIGSFILLNCMVGSCNYCRLYASPIGVSLDDWGKNLRLCDGGSLFAKRFIR